MNKIGENQVGVTQLEVLSRIQRPAMTRFLLDQVNPPTLSTAPLYSRPIFSF